MDAFWKIVGILMICVIITIILGRNVQELSVLLSVVGCILACVLAGVYLQEIVSFIEKLQTIGKMDGQVLRILLKTTGVALVTEISGQVFSDTGHGSQAKIMKLVGSAVIIWLSIPLLEQFVDLIMGILGEI